MATLFFAGSTIFLGAVLGFSIWLQWIAHKKSLEVKLEQKRAKSRRTDENWKTIFERTNLKKASCIKKRGADVA